MAILTVWPTDDAAGAITSEPRWRKMARHWAPTGVCPAVGGELTPTLAGGIITVKSGAAWVDGHYVEQATDQTLTATAAGLVVIRFDPAVNTAELLYRDAVSVPTQDPAGVWEMAVARIVANVLYDVRPWIATAGAFCTVEATAQYTPTNVETVVPFNGPGFRDTSGDLVRIGTTSGGIRVVRGGVFLIQTIATILFGTNGEFLVGPRLYRPSVASQVYAMIESIDLNFTANKIQMPVNVSAVWACRPGDLIEVLAAKSTTTGTIQAGGRTHLMVTRVGAESESFAS